MLFIWSTECAYLSSNKMRTPSLENLLFIKLTLMIQIIEGKVLFCCFILYIIDRLDSLLHLMHIDKACDFIENHV